MTLVDTLVAGYPYGGRRAARADWRNAAARSSVCGRARHVLRVSVHPSFRPTSAHSVTDDRATAARGEDERALFARLATGDEEAFDAIFRAWYPPLVRIAEGIVRERAVAEEVVQDVLLEVWRRREALGDEESPRAYLIRAARVRACRSLCPSC